MTSGQIIFGKTKPKNYLMCRSSKNALREEEETESLQKYFFGEDPASKPISPLQNRICIEHPHPVVATPKYFGEAAGKARSKPKTMALK